VSHARGILVVEPHAQGHHGPFLQWMLEALVEREFRVTLITLPESLRHPSLQHISRGLTGVVDVVSADGENRIREYQGLIQPGLASLIKRELAYWRTFRDWYRLQVTRKQPDIVFLPHLDYCLYAIGLLGSPFDDVPWVGVAMRPSFHYREMGVVAPRPSLAELKKVLFSRLLGNKYLKRLLTIDEPLVEYLRDRAPAGKVTFLPEPSDLQTLPDARDARRELGIDSERKVILVYGSLSLRKGVSELLRAIANPTCPKVVDVLIAGKVGDDLRGLLSEHWVQAMQEERRIKIVDRFITADEERILFAAVDMVWLGYRKHYTASGVLVQAARAGRPVIACEEGILGWQTRRHRLGTVVCLNDIASILAGIRALAENKVMCEACGINGRRAFEANSIDNAKEALSSAFQGRVLVGAN
jgi:glycosyltransferase involved in cell wall biosynthesis